MSTATSTFRRFEASDILEFLREDFFVYLTDPKQPKKKRKTTLYNHSKVRHSLWCTNWDCGTDIAPLVLLKSSRQEDEGESCKS
ncbi:hypothetical protein NLX71_25350 [Paenibacillus sp. MZ04-78.2]|uniref:hypothetical protein n=1 Tax=Paenibacillus sp. MZ04-78.2 TaxID=2962034 RepID=UPI0020B745FF|nr:hypothetical protein [Paenibacillus sp. MZ04-78.2]MCP3776575.1 hypothetical protein [Paenibacillus sp. MZ04-78.2]